MTTNQTLAIVLRRTNYSEADRILQLITPNGKCSVMAKGVRREKSRLAGGIELFAICEVSIADGKGELGILTSARLVVFFNHIMEDYNRMQFAYSAIKLVSGASEMVDGPDWYDLLAGTLAGLDSRSTQFDIIQTWFYLRYSALLGYELSLLYDVAGNKLSSEKKYHYDASERGLRESSDGEVTVEHIKLLRLIATKSLKIIAQISGVEEVMSVCSLIAREHASIR
jgi:DNA repair protein RecO (recombination protein O)